MTAPQSSYDAIAELVEAYRDIAAGGKAMEFDETSTRITLLNPFWEALGWKMADPREVVHEKRVYTRYGIKRADYCFNVRGKAAFVLEAKQAGVSLRDPDVVFQAKRYGYNLPVNFAVISDFEEFRLFDSGLEPIYGNPARGLIKQFDLTFDQYIEKWGDIYAVFSRDAVYDGALDALLPKARKTRNKEALDKRFFERLTKWREEFARVIALDNGDLSVYDINEAVQRILDRIIFIRVIEDREIEPIEHLQDALSRWRREKERPLYRYVVDVFRRMDPQYNGQLFSIHFSEDLLLRDKPLADFIKSLYYPDCPYQFNAIGVEMLGTIYERFLGSTITLTPAHRAKVEQKPEVRKAGGVYYTPAYIVDYIVENTVGELLSKCKKPNDALRLKILDPACGSGSFLLGAFGRLINWFEEYYNAHPEKISKAPKAECWHDKEHVDGARWRLTARYKGEILSRCLYGVDIDPQAVEVTIMSLYLRVLESINIGLLLKTALLPPLEGNVKCGNSLIGSDYWEFCRENQGQLFERGEAEERRVNTFDWDIEFPDIVRYAPGSRDLAQGCGFDAVIGNPPYVRPHNIESADKEYFWKKFTVFVAKSDIYACFIEKAKQLVKEKGRFGFIISNTWLSLESFTALRNLVLDNFKISNITITPKKVFEGATVETIAFSFLKSSKSNNDSNAFEVRGFDIENVEVTNVIKQGLFRKTHNSIFDLSIDEEYIVLIEKIASVSGKLSNLVKFVYGLKTADDEVFLTFDPKDDTYKKLLRRSDFDRYVVNYEGEYVWYVPKKMRQHRKTARPGEPARFEQPKILIQDIAKKIAATLDKENYYVKDALILLNSGLGYDLRYILGLLNSRFLNYIYLSQYKVLSVAKNALLDLPIREIDFSDAVDVEKHDRMVSMVDEMLDLHKRLAAAKSDSDRTRLERAIKTADGKIDRLVYGLYGLTEEEIKVVEGG